MIDRGTPAPVLLVGLLLPVWACGGGPGTEEAAEASEADTMTAVVEDTAAMAEDAAGEEEAAEQPAEGQPAAREPADEPAREAPARSRPTDRTAANATPEERPSPTVRATLPAGTEFPVTLDDSLDTRTTGAGDRFTAAVSQAVANDTRVVIPSGSEVVGRVTEVRQARGDSVGMLVLAVDSVRVRGTMTAVTATVVDAEVESRSEMTDEAAKIGGGAAAGAIIGAIAGKDVKSAIIGAAGGAAAGTAIAMGTREQYGVLPRGAVLRLRLEEPVTASVPR